MGIRTKRPNPEIDEHVHKAFKDLNINFADFLEYGIFCVAYGKNKEYLIQNTIGKAYFMEYVNSMIRTKEEELKSLKKLKQDMIDEKKEILEALKEFDVTVTPFMEEATEEVMKRIKEVEEAVTKDKWNGEKIDKVSIREIRDIAKANHVPLRILINQIWSDRVAKYTIGCKPYVDKE